MFLIIASLLDGGRLSIWVTVFRFGVFMACIPISLGNGTEGRDMPGWWIGSMKGKLVFGAIIGGQYMLREF